jgi:hypothetical protein
VRHSGDKKNSLKQNFGVAGFAWAQKKTAVAHTQVVLINFLLPALPQRGAAAQI